MRNPTVPQCPPLSPSNQGDAARDCPPSPYRGDGQRTVRAGQARGHSTTKPAGDSQSGGQSNVPLLKSCAECGVPSPATYCAECKPTPVPKADAAARGYDQAWRKLSERARRLQPWCLDCGTTDDLTADHTPEAWARKARGLAIRLSDVDVVCLQCNIARGAARGVGARDATDRPRRQAKFGSLTQLLLDHQPVRGGGDDGSGDRVQQHPAAVDVELGVPRLTAVEEVDDGVIEANNSLSIHGASLSWQG